MNWFGLVALVLAIGIAIVRGPAERARTERAIRAYFGVRNGVVLSIEPAGVREFKAHWYTRGGEAAYTVTVQGNGRVHRYVLVHGGVFRGSSNDRIQIIREIEP